MSEKNEFMDYTVSKKEIEEDVLEEIWLREQAGIPISLSELSDHFTMTKKMTGFYLKKMEEHGYIERTASGMQIRLTGLGKAVGSECRYRHEALSLFLQSIGAEPAEAEEKACRMEHLIGSALVGNICDVMKYGVRMNRTVKIPELNKLYPYGDHPCMVGIYRQSEKYPKRLMPGYAGADPRGVLRLKEKDAVLCLFLRTRLFPARLWYYENGVGWQIAVEKDQEIRIPESAIAFSAGTTDYVAVGKLVISFGESYESMERRKKMELIVRILE